MHVFVFHSVAFLKKFGSLLPLSMEGVELMNRKNKCVFRGGTDHGREDGVSDQVIISLYYNYFIVRYLLFDFWNTALLAIVANCTFRDLYHLSQMSLKCSIVLAI